MVKHLILIGVDHVSHLLDVRRCVAWLIVQKLGPCIEIKSQVPHCEELKIEFYI